jgi:hypothetical protein
MQWQWSIVAVQGGLMLLGFGLCLFLFFSLKDEIRRAEIRREETGRRVEASLQSLKAETEALRAGWQSLEERSGACAPAISPPDFQVTRRAQALRMHRRGEQPHQIAASLGLSVGEVELLLKVHRLTAAGN